MATFTPCFKLLKSDLEVLRTTLLESNGGVDGAGSGTVAGPASGNSMADTSYNASNSSKDATMGQKTLSQPAEALQEYMYYLTNSDEELEDYEEDSDDDHVDESVMTQHALLADATNAKSCANLDLHKESKAAGSDAQNKLQ